MVWLGWDTMFPFTTWLPSIVSRRLSHCCITCRCLHFSRADDIYAEFTYCYCYSSRQLGDIVRYFLSQWSFCGVSICSMAVSATLLQLHYFLITLHVIRHFYAWRKRKHLTLFVNFGHFCIILITNGTHTHTRAHAREQISFMLRVPPDKSDLFFVVELLFPQSRICHSFIKTC